ncbi:RING finger protein 157 [Cryptotermes secundus]|uniref:RING-type E3 ubiquitin transferase n=1 Tax=Cryptotermes secundus TaxID=105785 RepID=A0A2J7Q8K4_9NEOP|nr:RING finger protein 157 [Cryptotermes secundus]
MGALTSRQHAGIEEVDIVSNHAYKYPPRSGNYFGSHFIMGGERFDTPQPEAYLFGENADLNFLGSRPTPFPYPPPQANEPTKTLKSLVNIRKESLRFVRSPESVNKCGENDIEAAKSTQFNIEFTFDCDARCAITICYFCTEDFTANGVVYTPRDPCMNSETYHYKRGANQQFCQVSHTFDPSQYLEEELTYNPDRDVIPIAIHCVAEDGGEEPRQSHTTIAVVDRHSDGTYVLKALKQKLFVDGLCYLLQEIYGIENKNNDNNKSAGDEDTEDNGSECVICMCDVRDTLILPCRHLCLCNSCADSLRYQGSCENIPAGYESVSLIEALNGPCPTRSVPAAPPLDVAETPDQEVAAQAVEVLNRSSIERTPSSLKQASSPEECMLTKSPRSSACHTPEFRMSVLLAREEESHKDQTTKSPLLVQHCSRPNSRDKSALRPRDTVRLVNEKTVLDQDETQDEDSEAEKLSPLLDAATSTDPLPLDSVMVPHGDVLEDDDDLEMKVDVGEGEGELATMANSSQVGLTGKVVVGGGDADTGPVAAAGEDSDYYTPEDPPTTILSPLHADKVQFMEVEAADLYMTGERREDTLPHVCC